MASAGRWLVVAEAGHALGPSVVGRLPGAVLCTGDPRASVMGGGWTGVLVLTALHPDTSAEAALAVALHTVQAVAQGGRPAPSVMLVTRGSQAVGCGAVEPTHAGLWGFARCVRAEQPDLPLRCLDLGEADAAAEVERIVAELLLEPSDQHPTPDAVVRGPYRFTPRLVPLPIEAAEPSRESSSCSSEIVYETLGVGELLHRVGLPWQTTLAIVAYTCVADSKHTVGLRLQGAGSRKATGDGMEMAVSTVVTNNQLTGTLSAFVHAHLALHGLADVQPGEVVAVHHPTGGVGRLALRLAERAGATAHALAEPRVGESVPGLPGGRRADVLVGSWAAGEVGRWLPLLRGGGRLVAFGRRAAAEAQAVRPDVACLHADVAGLVEAGDRRVRMALEAAVECLSGAGPSLPELPAICLDADQQLAEAIRRVLRQGRAQPVVLRLPGRLDVPLFRRDGCYVVTGGLGGIGLAVARWMAEQGAGRLVLVSRSGRRAAGGEGEWERLARTGVAVEAVACDVADGEAVQALVRRLQIDTPDGDVGEGQLMLLRGVVHSAGVLEDAALLRQDAEKLRRVFRPKVAGAWNLHRLTLGAALDHFVLFSSVAAVFGSAGQSNYGAANACLDALAHHRRQRGLPATSVQWGAWAETGMAARQPPDMLARTARLGLLPLTPALGRSLLSRVFAEPEAVVSMLRLNTTLLARTLEMQAPHLGPLVQSYLDTKIVHTTPAPAADVARLANASAAERAGHVREVVLESVRDAMGTTPEPGVSLVDQGLDSVAIVELRNLLQTRLGVADLSVEAIMEDPTVEGLTKRLARSLADAPGLAALPSSVPTRASRFANLDSIPPELYEFDRRPEYLALRQGLAKMEETGKNLFFRPHETITRNTTIIDGQEVITFSNYNYIGMAGVPEVMDAAKQAIDQYGTTVSASRVAGGEKPLHRELERAIADLVGVQDAIVMLGGHTTNVNAIGTLCGAEDLVLHDALAHNSIVQGCLLSGARRLAFPHNDFRTLDRVLGDQRLQYNRVLVIIEGIYSVDGDIPDLPAFIEVKRRHKALLMVDEAHSIGVLGSRGAGVGEHFGVDPEDVDVWMGTLSKAFASVGGYIAGRRSLVEYLKYSAPGFVFSVGMSPANAAAALAAIRLMLREPDRVHRLIQRGRFFCELAKSRGLDTGPSQDTPVVPVIVGNSFQCIRLAQGLFARHRINVHPMVYPAVAEDAARLRFFITAVHTEEQLRRTVDAVCEELARVRAEDAAVGPPPDARQLSH